MVNIFFKGQVKIKCTIEGHPYRGSIANMGSGHCLIVLKSIRQAIGKQIGDTVTVVIQKDDEERIVIVPDDFQNALNSNPVALANFNKFSYTNRKEYVAWITPPKGMKPAKTESKKQ